MFAQAVLIHHEITFDSAITDEVNGPAQVVRRRGRDC